MVFLLIVVIIVILLLLKRKNSSQASEMPPDDENIRPLYFPADEIQSSYKITEPKVIPAEERMKTAHTDNYGLYPHEILVLQYAPSFFTDAKEFQGFWWYKYGVRDVRKILDSLLEQGFIVDCDVKSTVESLTVQELKRILAKNGISASGKKSDLANFVLEKIPAERLEKYFSRFKFGLTKKGKNCLKESEYISYIHKHGKDGLDIWTFNAKMSEKPKMSYRDNVWGDLNKQCIEALGKGDFGIYRNTKFNMSEFLCEEERFNEAYKILLEVVFYDLNDYFGNSFRKEFLGINLASYFDSGSVLKIPPGIMKRVNSMQERLSITDEQLKSDFLDTWKHLNLPFKVFSPEECAEIYFLERDGELLALKKMYSARRRKFASIIKQFD